MKAFRASYNSEENGPVGPPPSKKKSFEEGHYAIPVDLGGENDEIIDSVEDLLDGPVRSRGAIDAISNTTNNGLVEDFHFIEGTPAQFLNQQLASGPINSIFEEAPPPGLVKPLIDLNILAAGTKIRRSLAQKLKRHLDGSYSKYDGDRSSNSYPKDFSDGSHQKQRKTASSKNSITPTKELTKLHVNPIKEEESPLLNQSPPLMPHRLPKIERNESFDSSISSTARIDNAVLKGKERLKMSRRSSTSASQRNSTANESINSSMDNLVVEQSIDQIKIDSFNPKREEKELVDDSTETRSISQSISTAHTSDTQQNSNERVQNIYGNLCTESTSSTEYNQRNSLTISLEDLRDPNFKIRGISVTSLKENSISNGRSTDVSQRSLSICSELNSRIMFQRGRNRASGRSNKVVDVPIPPQHPPPLPPRKISSQPCMPKPLQTLSKFDGDYADIDDLMINERDVPSLLHSFNPLYSNASDALNQIPISNENIDYVQICPVATTALKELSTTRSGDFKRSNSLYDVFSLQKPKDTTTKPKNSENEFYASFDWTNAYLSPRAFTSSTSYLTHMLNKEQSHKKLANNFNKRKK